MKPALLKSLIFWLPSRRRLLGFFCVTCLSESSARREDRRHATFLPEGVKSNGEKDVVGHNRKRGLLHDCHFRPAVAHTCSSRRVPWHMQPDRDLLRHVL